MEQISMFELLGLDETPEIPFEQQKKGMKGWFIQISAIYTKRNGFEKNMVGVTTARVILERDSETDDHGQWQYAHVVEDGCNGDGWMGTPKKLYTRRPTWRELQEYVKKNHKQDEPYEIVYVRKDGHALHHICDFETRKPIHDF
jgi:hypothetical protein